MKHKRFEENILIDEAYTNYGNVDKNADGKKSHGIAKNFAETLEYDERKKWFHQLPQEPPTPFNVVNTEKLEELKKEANSALHGDTLAYETKANRSGSSDHQWAKTLLNKGAIGDRVAAATILIQDNPVYNLTAIRNLINNVKPAKKRDGIVIIDALSELIISDLLIPEVKLRTFEQHPVGHIDEISSGNKQARRNILKLWYFEDQLKQLYEVYVESLNKFAHDSVDSNKEKAVSSMSYLLMHHPEREKVLLCNIINKLGDPSQTVASKVIYHLCQVLYNHPNMKQVVLAEIEKMLFRTNISPRAQYYGVCFLNQFYLGKDDSKIAENLIRIYFSFFKASIKKGEIDSRLMSAILTGVKRAFPFADRDRISDAPEHINAIHKLVHLATFNVAIHALALLFQISSASKVTSDRYYTALYRKLTNADIFNTSHSALLFSLIYKSLRQDDDVNRVASFIKRLLHLSCFMNPAQICGMLFLISQVLKDSRKKGAVLLTWKPKEVKDEKTKPSEEIKEDLESGQEHDSNRETEEVNSSKVEDAEVNDDKVEDIRVDLLRGNKQDLLNDDDEETYVDLKIDNEGNIKPKKRKKSSAVAGWYHAHVKPEVKPETADPIADDRETNAKIAFKKTINMDRVLFSYDPFARNPSYSGAHCTAYLELTLLKQHYHPTVKLFAEKLVNNQVIQYSGDPLIDFSGIRFLDRFVFKNPKKRSELQQNDDQVKKVRGSHPKFALRKNYSAKGLKSISVTSASYLNEDVSRIPVDEIFLYDFLQKRRNEDDHDDDSDKDSVTSEDFDQYLDSVTGANKPEELETELDYLADMEATKQQEGANKRRQHDDDEFDDVDVGSDDDVGSDEDIGDNDESDDGDLNISGDEDEPELSGEDDELLLEESDEEDQIDVPGAKKGKSKLGLKLKGTEDLGSLFASAEEFSTLLEETATNKKQGSIHAVANTDNSSNKQMAWEEKRDRWIKGYNKKVLGHKKSKGNYKKEGFKNKKEGFKSKKEGFKNKKESFGKRKGGNIKGGGGKRKKFNK